MTITDRIRRWGEDVTRRADRRPELVNAVYDEDLEKILSKLGLLEQLERGDLRCAASGVVLTWDNLGGIVGSPNGPRLISDQALEPAEELAGA